MRERQPVDRKEKLGYIFVYDSNLSRPYPSVIIRRYEKRDGQANLIGVGRALRKAAAW